MTGLATLRRARVLLGVSYAYMLEYRAEIVLWMFAGVLPFILMGVWVQAGHSGAFGELGAVDFARYFLAVFLVRQVSVVWVIWDFEVLVVQGKLSPLLLQPMDPVWRFLADHLGERATRLPIVAVLIALFFAAFPSVFWAPSWDGALLALSAMLGAFVLRFLMQYTLAMLSFWVERASSLEQLMMTLAVFFSGLVAPLEVYPPLMRELVLWTPFPYAVYFPARLLVTGPGPDTAQGFAVLGVWCVVFFALNRWLWRAGLKKYSGMGA